MTSNSKECIEAMAGLKARGYRVELRRQEDGHWIASARHGDGNVYTSRGTNETAVVKRHHCHPGGYRR